MTYLLQTFRYYCLLQCATLSQALEFAPTDIAFIYRYLPVRAKIGIALLPCIFELSVQLYFSVLYIEINKLIAVKLLRLHSFIYLNNKQQVIILALLIVAPP